MVAAGRPAELASAQGVEVETAAGVRRFAAASRDDVPGIVERLVADGERVYDVRLVRSTLEDAYLAALGETADEAERAGAGAGGRAGARE